MSLISKIFTSVLRKKAISAPSGSITPVAGPGKFVMVNGTLTWMADNLESYIVNGYQANDIIYSCVNLIMEKIKVAPWGLYQVVDEGSLKQYHAFLEAKDFVKARDIRRKALEPITKFNPQLGRLNELLQWPNEQRTWNELVADDAGYICITGNNFMYGNLLEAGANKGLPGELWNAPAQHMGIVATRGFPQRAVGYQLKTDDLRKFSREEIMHEKLWNPSYSTSGANLYGQSPVKAAIRTVTRNNSSKKAGATQLDNNGAAGIAFIDDPVVPASGRSDQVKAVKEKWAQEYTSADNFGKVAFSGYKMGYVPVGLSLREMALTEIEAVDLRIIANIWGLPSQLLNDPENKTYNNAKEAEKALTSRCALPRLTSIRNTINRKLKTDWGLKGANVYVDFDMSVYTELQEDQKEKWGWVSQLPASSRYKMEMMGLDAEDDPNMDVVMVDGKLVPLADVVGGMSDQQLQQVSDDLNKAGIADYLRIAK